MVSPSLACGQDFVQVEVPKRALAWVRAVTECLRIDGSHIPVLRVVIDRVLELTRNVEVSSSARFSAMEDYGSLYKVKAIGPAEATEETMSEFCDIYDTHPDEVHEVEDYIRSNLKALPALLNHPLLTRMVGVDNTSVRQATLVGSFVETLWRQFRDWDSLYQMALGIPQAETLTPSSPALYWADRLLGVRKLLYGTVEPSGGHEASIVYEGAKGLKHLEWDINPYGSGSVDAVTRIGLGLFTWFVTPLSEEAIKQVTDVSTSYSAFGIFELLVKILLGGNPLVSFLVYLGCHHPFGVKWSYKARVLRHMIWNWLCC